MKLFITRFNQYQRTPDSELKLNRVLRRPSCDCFTHQGRWRELTLHNEILATGSDAWKSLEAYIQKVAADQGHEFNPRAGIGSEKWEQIIALPPSIGLLQSVKVLRLYGSHLVRIPPEIGEMTNLEEFDPYTSYRLHWFPYEITRCKKLKRSRVSTRALYGNWKNRAPFPRLPSMSDELAPACCSVCRGPFTEKGPYQRWVSLWVATDVLPLLVHACSSKCLQSIPQAPDGYVPKPHRGGLEMRPPKARRP
jgi:hypothetical protein